MPRPSVDRLQFAVAVHRPRLWNSRSKTRVSRFRPKCCPESLNLSIRPSHTGPVSDWRSRETLRELKVVTWSSCGMNPSTSVSQSRFLRKSQSALEQPLMGRLLIVDDEPNL